MLRDIYISTGGIGTFFIAVTMFFSFVGWLMAVTETITRPSLTTWMRSALILIVSLMPPLGILLSAWYVHKDRKATSKAMRAFKQAEKPIQAGELRTARAA